MSKAYHIAHFFAPQLKAAEKPYLISYKEVLEKVSLDYDFETTFAIEDDVLYLVDVAKNAKFIDVQDELLEQVFAAFEKAIAFNHAIDTFIIKAKLPLHSTEKAEEVAAAIKSAVKNYQGMMMYVEAQYHTNKHNLDTKYAFAAVEAYSKTKEPTAEELKEFIKVVFYN